MSQTKRLFWLITTLAFLSGCSGSRGVLLVRDDPAVWPDEVADNVKSGDGAEIKLQSGRIVTGEILRISNGALVLKSYQVNDLEETKVFTMAVYTVSYTHPI